MIFDNQIQKHKRTSTLKNLLPYWFILPAAVLMGIFLLYPSIEAINMSLHEMSLIKSAETPFVGLANYVKILNDINVWKAIGRTFIYTATMVGISMSVALMLALILNLEFKGRMFLRATVILPWGMGLVITGLIFTWIFDYQWGIVQFFLRTLGLANVAFFTNPKLSLISCAIPLSWNLLPIAALTLLAGLQTIDPNLYETADIDGANSFQKFFYITIPSIRSIFGLLVVLYCVWGLRSFDYIFFLTRGGPARSSETLGVLSYLSAFRHYDFGKGAALGCLTLVISLSFVVVYFYLQGKVSEYE